MALKVYSTGNVYFDKRHSLRCSFYGVRLPNDPRDGCSDQIFAGAVFHKVDTANHRGPIISTAVFIVFARNKIIEHKHRSVPICRKNLPCV